MASNPTKQEDGGHKTGQFMQFRYKTRKKGELPTNPAQPKEANPTTAAGAGMASASLADLGDTPVNVKRHKYAGKKCQAPKGTGICGAIISARNPHINVPICQPCAARLCDQARESGHLPDIEKIWRRLEARRVAAEKSSQLASRSSGVRESSPASGTQVEPGASEVLAKANAG